MESTSVMDVAGKKFKKNATVTCLVSIATLLDSTQREGEKKRVSHAVPFCETSMFIVQSLENRSGG